MLCVYEWQKMAPRHVTEQVKALGIGAIDSERCGDRYQTHSDNIPSSTAVESCNPRPVTQV
jgi:hypothetical protein